MLEKEYLMWLKNVKGIGNKSLEKLINYFGSAEEVFRVSAGNLLKFKGINQDALHNIIENRDPAKLRDYLVKMRKYNIEIIDKENSEYPENLKQIYDPPFILYKKGCILEEDINAVAIVGSRRATPYGKWVAYKLAGELVKKGITVISGMAYGVDTAAHKGALEQGGRTLAILGCGLDTCYPKSNYNLMLEIEKHGAVISEYGLGIEPKPTNFPARNRIISGMAKGVIVVEASIKSGSLITAEQALEQGREVFAIPGNINSNLSKGTNKLIQEGAKLVTSIEDVFEELNIEITESLKEKQEKDCIQLSETESQIYHAIQKNQPIQMDLLLQQLKLGMDKIGGIITILQLKGLVDQLPGKMLITKNR